MATHSVEDRSDAADPVLALLDVVAAAMRAGSVDGEPPEAERAALSEAVSLLGQPAHRVDVEPARPTVVDSHLDDGLVGTTPATAVLGAAVRDAAPLLHWVRSYDDPGGRGDLGDTYAAAIVAGPANALGMYPVAVETDHILISVTVLAPGSVYPLHRHLARELYLPIAGVADWYRDTDGWTTRAPGDWILHGVECGHAMRAGAVPLVALAVWIDNLDCPAPHLEL